MGHFHITKYYTDEMKLYPCEYPIIHFTALLSTNFCIPYSFENPKNENVEFFLGMCLIGQIKNWSSLFSYLFQYPVTINLKRKKKSMRNLLFSGRDLVLNLLLS